MEFTETTSPVFNFLQCLEELILNSINGHSSGIAIRINWNTYSIQVLDNGTGISVEVLNSIGLRPTLQIAKLKGEKYRTFGRTLFLINQLSGNLSVVTQQRNSNVSWERTFARQNLLKHQKVDPRKCCGTTITIDHYLCNSEELRSELNIPSQMDKIKNLVNSFTLLHSEISFSVRDDSTIVQSYDVYQIGKFRNTKEAAEQLFSFNSNGKLFPFHQTSHHFKIKGLVGNRHLKNYQFVYVNSRPIDSIKINNLMESILHIKGSKQNLGIIVNIKCNSSQYQLLLKWDRTEVEFKHWDELLRLLTSSLSAIHRHVSDLDLKSDQIGQWLENMQDDSSGSNNLKNEYQTLKKDCNKSIKAPGTYTAIKQRDIKLSEKISKEKDQIDIENMEISKENCEARETLKTSVKEKYLLEGLAPLTGVESIDWDLKHNTMVTDLKYPLYGKLEERMNEMVDDGSPVFRRSFSPVASAPGPVVLSLVELQRDWVDETNPEDIGIETTRRSISDIGKLENVLEEILDDIETDDDFPNEDGHKSCKQKRGLSNFVAPCPAKVQRTELENWVRISDSNISYFCNTLTGNTSYEMPPIHQKTFEFHQKTRLNYPSINFKALQIPNEFWVNHKQPPNVSKTSSNSFPHFRAILRYCRFNKHIFETLDVVKQIDQKFICCIAEEKDRNFLILVDQHAAHERVCLEKLIKLHSKKDSHGFIQIQSSPLQPHLQLTFTPRETDVLRKLTEKLIGFGLSLTIANETNIFVTRVPSCFLERETSEIRRGRTSVYDKLTETLLRDIITEYSENGRVGTCLLPASIRNVLNSLACHGAIKFGDRLTHKQCTQLVRALAECDVPFQCAHGRPSITPLLDIGELARLYNDVEARPRYGRLMQMI